MSENNKELFQTVEEMCLGLGQGQPSPAPKGASAVTASMVESECQAWGVEQIRLELKIATTCIRIVRDEEAIDWALQMHTQYPALAEIWDAVAKG